jgi:hypothetical protein
MNDKRNLLLGLGVGIVLCACARPVPYGIGAPVLDSHFGEAVIRARAMQTINPEGVTVTDAGYSGKAAHKAMDLKDVVTNIGAPPPQAIQMLGMPGAQPK